MANDVQQSNQAVQAQFSRNAQKYETSIVHAHGEDLAWMVEAAALTGTERVLDVGTGTGHTALALAPTARTVTGADLTARMIESATSLAESKGLANVQFVVSDVVHMPFPSEYFDVVTCRFASHHFANPDAAATEISRVLKPGGRVFLIDHVAPEPTHLDTFINRLDWLRDPSHVREWTVPEWQQKFARVGITAHVARSWLLPLEFKWWIQQAATAADRQAQILDMLTHADAETRATFHIHTDEDGQPLDFSLHCVLMEGRKR